MARASGLTILSKLGKLVGLIVILGVLAAGVLLPYVGGAGLLANTAANKFLDTTCTLTEEPVQQKTTMLASDGTTPIATLFDQNRSVVSLSKVPKFLTNALIATEDRRFYEHHGVDLRGLVRGVLKTSGGSTQGASTLTEQYVKQVRYYQATTPAQQAAAIDQNIDRKISDAQCALKLEKQYSKAQILEKYLNIAFFGENSYGIQTASQTFFGVDVNKLSIPQAALLVGLVKAPSDFDPFLHPQDARARRDLVLGNMAGQGYITAAAAKKYIASPIKLAPHAPPARGCTFANPAIKNVGFFCDYVYQWLQTTGGLTKSKIDTGGYKIITTIDASLQNQVQSSLWTDMPLSYYGDPKQDPAPSAAIMPGLDPTTGEIKYLATSRQYGSGSPNKTQNPIFTIATSGSGSTFKYFTTLAALKLGVPDYFKLTTGNAYHTKNCPPGRDPVPNGYTNAGHYADTQTLRSALVESDNTYFVGMEDMVFNCDMQSIIQTAKDVGYTGINDVEVKDGKAVNGKSLAANIVSDQRATFTLGQEAISPLDLTSSYGTAANGGVLCPPVPVKSVVGPDGKAIPYKRPGCSRKIDEYSARMVIDIMRGDTTSGTAAGAFGSWTGGSVAGKTGTNNGTTNGIDDGFNSALWFVGSTPNLVSTTAIYNPDAPTHDIRDAPGHIGDAINAFGAVGAGLWVNALKPTLGTKTWDWPSPQSIPNAVQVQDVRGQSADTATNNLVAQGFKVAILPSQVCGSVYPEGTVALAGPAYAAPGATISVCMSNGKAPFIYVAPTRVNPTRTPGRSTAPAPTTAANPAPQPTKTKKPTR